MTGLNDIAYNTRAFPRIMENIEEVTCKSMIFLENIKKLKKYLLSNKETLLSESTEILRDSIMSSPYYGELFTVLSNDSVITSEIESTKYFLDEENEEPKLQIDRINEHVIEADLENLSEAIENIIAYKSGKS